YRPNDCREDQLTSSSPTVELVVSQRYLRLQQTHECGGQSCHSLARSPWAWMSIKTRWPLLMSPMHSTPRSATAVPLAHTKAILPSLSEKCRPTANSSCVSMKRVRVGMGSPALPPSKATPAGLSPPH